jgi:hypothetical protein
VAGALAETAGWASVAPFIAVVAAVAIGLVFALRRRG